jgi:hypothetical protein
VRANPNSGVGEIDPGFAIPQRGKRVFNIDPPTPSNAIMQRARAPTAERTVNPAAHHGELDIDLRVREQPRLSLAVRPDLNLPQECPQERSFIGPEV